MRNSLPGTKKIREQQLLFLLATKTFSQQALAAQFQLSPSRVSYLARRAGLGQRKVRSDFNSSNDPVKAYQRRRVAEATLPHGTRFPRSGAYG